MTHKTTISLKNMADAYGISTKTLSKRIKTLLPELKNNKIRTIYPAQIEKIRLELGDFQ